MQQLLACSPTPAVSPAVQTSLKAVQETSGLLCAANRLWTINDSGNSPTLYQVDPQHGVVSSSVATDASNQDWEALTLMGEQLIVADIGNNSGSRRSISLYLFDWPLRQGKTATSRRVDFSYPSSATTSSAAPLQPYMHNLDAEALAASPAGLFLFSKNWLADSSTVYRVDLTKASLSAQTEINGLPGMLTDISFAPQAQLFVATGYRNIRKHGVMFALTGDFQPFLALIDQQFKLVKVVDLDGQGQVEGVCVDEQQQIWLSQEQSDHHPSQFWRWGTVPELAERQ